MIHIKHSCFFNITAEKQIEKQTNIYLATNTDLTRCERAKRWKNINGTEEYKLLSFMLLQGKNTLF